MLYAHILLLFSIVRTTPNLGVMFHWLIDWFLQMYQFTAIVCDMLCVRTDILVELWIESFSLSPSHSVCVLQSLLLLQYLVRNGSERVVTSAREHVYDLKPLENFQFIDETGKDQGLNGVLDLDQLWTPTNCDESMCICVCACMRACVRATSTPFAPLNPPCLSPLLLFSPLPSTHLCTLLPLLPSSHPPPST